ncbi:hypothetical protein CP532_0113 [Ophiocordyceps camponoti-leonardi (nom. inval.)]|nr:hypothetical protein CP532_0113 [Ophiocordyceps camponoti-leonardi (nom. inval.)]
MEDSLDPSLTDSVNGIDLNKQEESSLFSRTDVQSYDADTPRTPYLTFTTPGKPAHLVIKIWSADQGWCDSNLVIEHDVYVNSWTWFALGPVSEGEAKEEDLHHFQTNVRASKSAHLHTNEWKLGHVTAPQVVNHGLDKFLDSFTKPPRRSVGIYPLARYPGWENGVWKIEVEIKDYNADWQPHDSEEIVLHRSSRHVSTRKPPPPSDVASILRCPLEAVGNNLPELVEAIEARLHDPSAQAIIEIRRAISLTPLDHPDRPRWFAILASTLSNRHIQSGVIEDLHQAIGLLRKVIETVDPSSRHNEQKFKFLANLANCLRGRFERLGETKDLREAIELSRQSIDISPDGDDGMCKTMSGLSAALRLLFLRSHEQKDIEEAIAVGRKAVSLTVPDTIDEKYALMYLEQSLAASYDYDDNKLHHLDEAISLTRRAIATATYYEDDPEIRRHLGDYLYKRYQRTASTRDRDESLDCLSDALRRGNPMECCLAAGRRLLSAPEVLDRGVESVKDAEKAIDLFVHCRFYSYSPTDLRYHVSQAGAMTSDAAAVALHLKRDPVAALRLLEGGRGILARFVESRRQPDPRARHADPEKIWELEVLKFRLERWAAGERPVYDDVVDGDGDGDVSSAYFPSSTDQIYIDSDKLIDTISLIDSEIPESGARFSWGMSKEIGKHVATEGPIITLNTSVHRCDALITLHSGTRSIQLTRVSHRAILDRIDAVQSLSTLEWLWDCIVEPILESLGFVDSPPPPSSSEGDDDWPHVWWIPTGPLTKFPIHAAGYHLDGSNRSALDRVVSSYGTSINSIDQIRRRPILNPADYKKSVLVLSIKDTPGLDSLSYTDTEAQIVRTICSHLPVPVISPDPYRDTTLSELKTCTIFHFAGHGQAKPNPLQSLLYLQDWEERPLTVASLIETNLVSTSPFLAYLSACGTGKNQDEDSADENLNLTSVFQTVGFRHVIGTLWEVDDYLCVDMAGCVYLSLAENGLSDEAVAKALHKATRILRKKWLDEEMEEAKRRKRDAILRGRREGQEIKDEEPSSQDLEDVKITNQEFRDVVFNCAADTKAPLWVPYVHFGV